MRTTLFVLLFDCKLLYFWWIVMRRSEDDGAVEFEVFEVLAWCWWRAMMCMWDGDAFHCLSACHLQRVSGAPCAKPGCAWSRFATPLADAHRPTKKFPLVVWIRPWITDSLDSLHLRALN